ncbi:chemotaxis protein [Vibrio fluvialis]|uniref:chemotaxis protein n=1 Tax=Vibrio fluvialis TaxID=676 RepID=UPI001C9C9E89|nr:chemotaxis protein [Vibrio fluvialis]MBY8088890.1 chemotaxis protein [Vibrio fluvialis]MBY8186397.1 chemotaxis protein [Vibrio fluvialis]MCE7595102.1 chemotaxis protein [Vibrio fluvialis]
MNMLMKSIDQRTNLAGQNRFEMLLFSLNGHQRFGINVFKVREVIRVPELIEMPGAHPFIKGIAQLRGNPVIVIDLSEATTGKPIRYPEQAFVIVTEYNRHIQGFLVSAVDRIVNLNWSQIQPPPQGAGQSHYLTAVTEIEGKLIQVIDVEKVFSEIIPSEHEIEAETAQQLKGFNTSEIEVLVADDSAVARNQIKRVLDSVNIPSKLLNDGQSALQYLQDFAAKHKGVLSEKIPLVISDIEMPIMDGYTLTSAIKSEPLLKDIHVVLHSSLSGVFNESMVKKVGADQFIAKFHPDELLQAINHWLLMK